MISIHALREEGDLFISPRPVCSSEFLSTPSARRATAAPVWQDATTETFLSTPSARRATPVGLLSYLLGGFLSTPSARRATTSSSENQHEMQNFYPRPPRGGRPSAPSCRRKTATYFYPRPPRGGRPCQKDKGTDWARISIHALREEGDLYRFTEHPSGTISIHALREEGDPLLWHVVSAVHIFLSTPSARRATFNYDAVLLATNVFLSTPSARRATFLS